MSPKVALYIVTSITIMFIFQQMKEVSIEFIKAANASSSDVQQGILMLPNLGQPQRSSSLNRDRFAINNL